MPSLGTLLLKMNSSARNYLHPFEGSVRLRASHRAFVVGFIDFIKTDEPFTSLPVVKEEIDKQVFSKRGSRVGSKKRLSKGSVDVSSLLGLRGRKVILSIVSSGSLSVLSSLDVDAGAVAEDSILAERPLSGLVRIA